MLKNEISHQANKVWQLLLERGKMSIVEIGELTNFKESFIHLALGWLSKENKICFVNNNGTLYVEQEVPISETYY